MSKFKSILEQKFGKLFIKREFKEAGRWKVECECDCGEKCTKLRCHVLSGGTKSCGCNIAICAASKNWKGCGEISGDYWSSLRRNASKRGLTFNIDIAYAWELYLKQNGKCAISGEPIGFVLSRRKNYKNQTASLDRIDSTKGYEKNNVWWVHKEINKIKSNFSINDIVDWSKKIANHNVRGSNFVKWDRRFITLAKHIASWSKDDSTKVGAVIYDSSHRIISTGYNGLAANVKDVGLEDRDRKYKTIIHAEINAILFAETNLHGCTIATWPFQPCSNCSSAIIQSGIKRVVFPKSTDPEKNARWLESFNLARSQFSEAGVIMEEYEID